MQHVWRTQIFDPSLGLPVTPEEGERQRLMMRPTADVVQELMQRVVTNKTPCVTNSERAQAWNKANRKQYNARQKLLMAGKRAKRGG